MVTDCHNDNSSCPTRSKESEAGPVVILVIDKYYPMWMFSFKVSSGQLTPDMQWVSNHVHFSYQIKRLAYAFESGEREEPETRYQKKKKKKRRRNEGSPIVTRTEPMITTV
jgi:hypothetical protein